MKFLIFNIVVAGALIFLFAGNKGDLTAVAQKAEQVVSKIKTEAVEAVGPKPETPPPAKPVTPSVNVTKPAAAPVDASPSVAKPKAPASEPAAQPLPSVTIADRTPKAPLPPAVAKRRAEVLDEGATVVSEGSAEKFMPAEIRKRELMLLSEKMEMFSAEAISR